MEKVTIKRVKRNTKKPTTKEKILAGLGLGSTLLGGIASVSPKPQTTQFTRSQGDEAKNSGSKVKNVLNQIFGVPVAQASTDYSTMSKDELAQLAAQLNVPNQTPQQQAEYQAIVNAYYGRTPTTSTSSSSTSSSSTGNSGSTTSEGSTQGTASGVQAYHNGQWGAPQSGDKFTDGAGVNYTFQGGQWVPDARDTYSLPTTGNKVGDTKAVGPNQVVRWNGVAWVDADIGTAFSDNSGNTFVMDASGKWIQGVYMTNPQGYNQITGEYSQMNPISFATLEAAKGYAQLLGGTVEAVTYDQGPYRLAQPQYVIRVGNAVLNAGLVAQTLNAFPNGMQMIQQEISKYNSAGVSTNSMTKTLEELHAMYPSINVDVPAANVSGNTYTGLAGQGSNAAFYGQTANAGAAIPGSAPVWNIGNTGTQTGTATGQLTAQQQQWIAQSGTTTRQALQGQAGAVEFLDSYFANHPERLPQAFAPGSYIAYGLSVGTSTSANVSNYNFNFDTGKYEKGGTGTTVTPRTDAPNPAATVNFNSLTDQQKQDMTAYYGGHPERLPDAFAPGSFIAFGLGLGGGAPDLSDPTTANTLQKAGYTWNGTAYVKIGSTAASHTPTGPITTGDYYTDEQIKNMANGIVYDPVKISDAQLLRVQSGITVPDRVFPGTVLAYMLGLGDAKTQATQATRVGTDGKTYQYSSGWWVVQPGTTTQGAHTNVPNPAQTTPPATTTSPDTTVTIKSPGATSGSTINVSISQRANNVVHIEFVDPNTNQLVSKDFSSLTEFSKLLQSYNVGGNDTAARNSQAVFAALGSIGQNWNKVATGTVLPLPQTVTQSSVNNSVWTDQNGNRAVTAGALGINEPLGVLFYDAGTNTLYLDHGNGQFETLTGNQAYNQARVIEYTNLIKAATATPDHTAASNDTLLKALGRNTATVDAQHPLGTGAQSTGSGMLQQGAWYSWTDSSVVKDYGKNANAFKADWQTDATGKVTSITITTTNAQGQQVLRTFPSPQALMNFLDTTSGQWAGLNPDQQQNAFAGLPDNVKAMYTAANAARSYIPNFPNIQTTNRVVTPPGTAQLISTVPGSTGQVLSGMNPEYFTTPDQANAALAAIRQYHPDAKLVDMSVNSSPGWFTSYGTDPRVGWMIVYNIDNGSNRATYVDPAAVLKQIGTSGQLAKDIPGTQQSFFATNNGINVVFNTAVPKGSMGAANTGAGTGTPAGSTGQTSSGTPALGAVLGKNPFHNNENVMVTTVNTLDGSLRPTNGVLSDGSTIEIGGYNLDGAYNHFSLMIGTAEVPIDQAVITANKITLHPVFPSSTPNGAIIRIKLLSANPALAAGQLSGVSFSFTRTQSSSLDQVDTETQDLESSDASGTSQSQSTYVVQPGDTLWSIAQKVYQSGTQWDKILSANSDTLHGPQDLRVGMVLRIPS